MSKKRIRIYVDSKIGKELNHLTKYFSCDRVGLMEALIKIAYEEIISYKSR